VWNDHEEQLTSDCAGPMTIGKSGITVKLNGKTVSCGGDATKNGIVITNLTNVHVAGGNVTACGLGVYISGGGGHQINGMNVSGNLWHGFLLGPLTVGGVFIEEGSNYNSLNSAVLDGNGEWGVKVNGDHNSIHSSVITNTLEQRAVAKRERSLVGPQAPPD
jgi:hypothetical protein